MFLKCAANIYPSNNHDFFPVILLLTNHKTLYNFNIVLYIVIFLIELRIVDHNPAGCWVCCGFGGFCDGANSGQSRFCGLLVCVFKRIAEAFFRGVISSFKLYWGGVYHGGCASFCGPGFGPSRDLKLLFPLQLHDGGSCLRLIETLALNIHYWGWYMLLVISLANRALVHFCDVLQLNDTLLGQNYFQYFSREIHFRE